MDRFKIQRDCSEKSLEKARVELRETPEVREQGFKELREILAADKTLNYATRDDVLIRYLRPTKWYAKSAFELMKREAEFKEKHKEVLEDLTPATVDKVLDENAPINVLVDRDQDGRRILICHTGEKWKTAEVSNVQVFQMMYLIHEAALLEPETQINGIVVILDFKGMGMKQIANLTPKFALLLLTFIQHAMPLRLKQVHIVNEPMMFKVVWNVFKPFIQEKLNKRLYFHGSKTTELHKLIDPKCLPKDYAGVLPKIDYSGKEWKHILEECNDIIKENNTFGLRKA